MRIVRPKNKQSGFTLVELLIVAIILAILAAIIVPQFASTTVDAQEAALRSNLSGMRSAIDLYRQQHGEYPGALASTGGTCSTGTAGGGAEFLEQAIVEQLTRYSNAAGQTCSRNEDDHTFGPYVSDDDLPDNPISGSGVLAIVSTGDLIIAADGANGGWKYDYLSGKLIANDNTLDSQSVAYDTY